MSNTYKQNLGGRKKKKNNERTHTLNKHTWRSKTLCRDTTLAKITGYFEKKVKSFELPPHLSLKKLYTMFLFKKKPFKN